MAAGFDHITLEEDSDFHATWVFYTDSTQSTVIDLSSYTFEAKIADKKAGTVWTNCDSGGFVNSESRTAGAIRLWGGNDGILHMYIEEATVNALAGNETKGVFTINSNDGTDVTREIQGTVSYVRSAI